MVVFVILQIASVVAYCVAEGTIDAARAKQLAEEIGKDLMSRGGIKASLAYNKNCTAYEAFYPAEDGPAAPQDETIPVEFRA